jgi:hypothetical protein
MILVGLVANPVIGAETVRALPAAPVPTQVLSAKKGFLSNLGADAGAAVAFHYMAHPDAAYNGFFAVTNKIDANVNASVATLVDSLKSLER